MPIHCVVEGCKNNNVSSNLRFFCFPAVRKTGTEATRKLSTTRQERWLEACPVPKVSSTQRICAKHFSKGFPAELEDVTNVDWIPSLFLRSTDKEVVSAELIGQSSCQSQNATNALISAANLAAEDISGSAANCMNLSSGGGAWSIQGSRDCPVTAVVSNYVPGTDQKSHQHDQPSFSGNSQAYEASAPATADESDQASSTPVMMPLETTDPTDLNSTSDWQWLADLVPESYGEQSDDYDWMIEDTSLHETNDPDESLAEEMDWTPNSSTQAQESPNLLDQSSSAIEDSFDGLEDGFENDIARDLVQIPCRDDITRFTTDVCVQTCDMDQEHKDTIARYETTIRELKKQNGALERRCQQLATKLAVAEKSTRYSVTDLDQNDGLCNYITGISSSAVLKELFEAVKHNLPKQDPLEKEKLFVMALRKLRLNEPFHTLGLLYGMHQSIIADRFYMVINQIYPFMRSLVKWPSREALKKHMPAAFRAKYGDKVTIILDCFEVPIESPRSEQMTSNANVYSYYKHHKTIKVLAGVAPNGVYSFISEAFGGRTSDQKVTEMSGILDFIQDGDFVLADRGFLIEDLLRQKNASLAIPAFKKANRQLEPLDACDSKELSALRIHVERMIGSLRQKILVLMQTIPISMLERWNGDMLAIDQIIMIAAAIVNLCPSIVSE